MYNSSASKSSSSKFGDLQFSGGPHPPHQGHWRPSNSRQLLSERAESFHLPILGWARRVSLGSFPATNHGSLEPSILSGSRDNARMPSCARRPSAPSRPDHERDSRSARSLPARVNAPSRGRFVCGFGAAGGRLAALGTSNPLALIQWNIWSLEVSHERRFPSVKQNSQKECYSQFVSINIIVELGKWHIDSRTVYSETS